MALKGGLSCSSVLWYVMFLGCGVNYMIRSNINIAIVAMVKARESMDETAVVSECVPGAGNVTVKYTLNDSAEEVTETVIDESRFDWDEHEQNMVMGAFFWLYWIAQMPGGMLGQYYGSKKVFGFSNLFISVTTLLVPLCSFIDYKALVALRVLQGVSGGFCWPSLNYMISRWVPPNERGKFMSAYMGSSVGAALTFPLCGMLIHYINWQAVFYVTGILGIIWFISWWLLVYDRPAEHPRITQEELKHIQNSVGSSVSDEKMPIPWFKILTNVPLLVNILLAFGGVWGLFTLLTQAPTYFHNVHGWSFQMVGLLSGFPFLTRMILAISVGYLCDYLQTNGKLSVTNVRKMAGIITNILQGLFTMGLALCGCNSMAAIICLTAALTCTGAESAGPLATYLDLSPNFSSILMGIGNMVCVTPGFLSASLVGFLTYKNQTSDQWKKVFLISGGLLLGSGLVHLVAASAKMQDWNLPHVGTKELTDDDLEKDVEAQKHLTSEEIDWCHENIDKTNNHKPEKNIG